MDMYAYVLVHYAVRSYFFFFQAEDGIRDVAVTGVQTCALPISGSWFRLAGRGFLLEKLCRLLRGEKAALRFCQDRHRVGRIGTVEAATRPSAWDGHPIRPLSACRR